MKRTKFILISLIIALTFVMNAFTVFSFDKSTLPLNIKVGLFFGSAAKSALQVESESSFKVGSFAGDEFNSLFDLNENKIVLRKDNIEGPFHVQIGQNFNTYGEANNFLTSLNIGDANTYLAYENEWKVFSGSHSSEAVAKEEGDKIKAQYGYDTKIVLPSSTRVQVVNGSGKPVFMYDSIDEVYFVGKYNGSSVPIVNVEGTKYRGAVTAKRLSNSDMTIINKLPLDEYLYGVVPGEMPATWNIEALKAQAVSARTFALANLNKYKQFDFNVCTTVNSQVYKGFSSEHPNTNRAVDETKSKVITSNGKLVQTFYHSNSGGYTEDSENVWSSVLPHARGVKDDFSLNTTNSTWDVTFTKDEIKSRLATHNIFIGDILDMRITSVSNNGRVLSLALYGTEGQAVMEKQKSRTVLGLKSNYFSIKSNSSSSETNLVAVNSSGYKMQLTDIKGKHVVSASGVNVIKDNSTVSVYNGVQYKAIDNAQENTSNTFVIEGKGNGHGVGMSQYGANNMAQLGYKYDDILKHYYTGVKVE